MYSRSWRFQFLSLAVMSFAGCWLQQSVIAVTSPETGKKHALVVAIAEYAADTGWHRTSADSDLGLVRAALEAQEFTTIHQLVDSDATRDGIVRSFREKLLKPAEPGDLVVFYYAGHGQQLKDDGNDEIDGYDEALVPHDAPAFFTPGYRGERHLRDDTLALLMLELRKKLGPRGHVVAFLDSCFSGTPRGTGALDLEGSTERMIVRGGAPLGPPARQAIGVEAGSGLFESAPGEKARLQRNEEMASYVVFSAARHDQFALETMGDQNRLVGSLTYAVTRELATVPPDATYLWLYERIRWLMARRVENEPQVEGDVDTLLFRGLAVPQDPFVRVESVHPSGREVVLAAGSLVGLRRGARAEVHRSNSLQFSAITRLASGEVVSSTPTRATLRLDAAVDIEELERGRVSIDRYSLVDQRFRVRIAIACEVLATRLHSALEANVEGVEIGKEAPDLVVRSTSDGQWIEVETFYGRLPLMKRISAASPDLEARLTRRLTEYARSRALRSLDVQNSDFPVTFELLPFTGAACPGQPKHGSKAGLAPVTDLTPVSSRSVWDRGECFKIRIHNRSPHAAYINVLDLPFDGSIEALWPSRKTGDQTPVPANQTTDLREVYVIADPPGNEVILLVASRRWLDMRPFLTASSYRGSKLIDSLGLPEPARDTESREDQVSTYTVTFTVR